MFGLGIYYSKHKDAYQIIDIESVELKAGCMSGDHQSLLDNMITLHPPPGLEGKIKHSRHPSGSSATMDQVKKHWGQEENFKDVLRKEVLDYIIKGFEKTFKDVKGGSSLLDIEEEQGQTEKPPLFRRIVLFCLGKEEANAENYEDDGNKSALLGHPDVLKKVSILTQSQIDKEAYVENS